MQWTSFISAQVLYYHPDLHQHFENQINNERVVNVYNLLYTDAETPNLFRDQFTTYLRQYIFLSPLRPNTQANQPRFPIRNGGTSGEDLFLDIEGEVEGFFEYILDENCLEIYVPNVLNYTSNKPIISTSHPLNNDSSNEGYQFRGEGEQGYHADIIDFVALIRPKNRLITRPFRVQAITGNCTYPEYAGIDFTLFPNN